MISRSRNTHMCCVTQCSSSKGTNNTFHSVPKDDLLRKKWEAALNTNLSRHMRICSIHFKNDDYLPSRATRRHLKKQVVPSVNLPSRIHVVTKILKEIYARGSSSNKRGQSKLLMDGIKKLDTSLEIMERIKSVHNQVMDKQDITVLFTTPVSFIDYLSDENTLYAYTGVPTFKVLDIFERCVYKLTFDKLGQISDSSREKIILCLMKIRLPVSFSALGALFAINQQTCLDCFYFMCPLLSNVMRSLVVWISHEEVKKNILMSSDFFKKIEVAVGCFKLFLRKGKCCKNHQGVTVFLGISLKGCISFVSRCRESYDSDVATFISPKLPNCFKKGGIVILHRDVFQECSNKNTSSFESSGTIQTTITQCNTQFHVESVIQKLKEFHVLKRSIPCHMNPFMSDILTVVCGLVNLGKSALYRF